MVSKCSRFDKLGRRTEYKIIVLKDVSQLHGRHKSLSLVHYKSFDGIKLKETQNTGFISLKVAKSEANTIFQNKFNIFFTKSRV
jgi:hypothetical protein